MTYLEKAQGFSKVQTPMFIHFNVISYDQEGSSMFARESIKIKIHLKGKELIFIVGLIYALLDGFT